MRVLGIETSCDETAVALVETNPWTTDVLASIISSQVALHRPYGGVVPEMATREHLKNLPLLVPQVMKEVNLGLDAIDAIAATEGPGLASSLLIGHSYARAMSVALSKPMVGVNHLEGHLYSPFIASKRAVEFPFVGLIVSGGHTLLVHVLGWDRYVKLGSTVDDAAGEAFDKVAKLLGLPYPGGPEIEKLAKEGDSEAFGLPRSFPERDNLNFSFSGLKTAVRFFFEKSPQLQSDPAWVRDLCASFQKAVVDVLARKAVQAVSLARVDRLVASGGVLCNQALRHELEYACHEAKIDLVLAEPALCTDNAAMIAGAAAEKLEAGIEPYAGADINPNLNLFAPEPNGDFARSLNAAIKLKNRQKKDVPQKNKVSAPGEIEVW
ncbi:MAG TPA: tRNA (adenosine(37)-N6)-threonylcarbamoyltransferase complex transferase subunit TsaD [Candidatus Methylacidiphilales bacterium]|nr:tRNA (adenosine(37)-N6)-threonylcarbamoyltransferase complex transferase subunit TsaD [Candidatus Methylacidiphilales bacterium]